MTTSAMDFPTANDSIEALTRTDVCAACRISKATLDRLLRDGRFPRPFYISERAPRWTRDDIRGWLRSIGEQR